MLRALTLPIFLALTCLNPGQAGAHPHEFIDTAITLRTDEEGRLGAIGVVWVWDDLTSMLIIEDLGMDSDGNGELTAEEKQRLAAQFSQWPEDYGGDLYLTWDGKPVELTGPLDMKADYLQGRLVLNYLRALPERIRLVQTPVILQAYDPSYYVFYDLVGIPEVRGRDGCRVSIRKADIGAAQKLYDQLLGQLTEEEMMEQGKFPEVGGAFADQVVLECDARP
jgi:polyphosphate kinase